MTNLAFPPQQSHPDDDEKLGQRITLLAGRLNAGCHAMMKPIAEFDRRKAWSGGGTVRSCAHWLNWKCGYSIGAAREKVRVAHCLENLPLIDASFAAGEISYSKARAMTKAATPENEDFLLEIARHGTASHMEKVVRKYRKVRAKDDDASESEQDNARKLVYYQDNDDMWVIHAKLPPEAGAAVVKAIEAIAAPEQAQRQEELRREKLKEKETRQEQVQQEHLLQEAPEKEQLREEQRQRVHSGTREQDSQQDVSAETFSEAVREEEPSHYQELMEHTRADALAKMAEHFLATVDENPQLEGLKGLKGSERCQIMLHVDINTLRQQGQPPGPANEHCHVDDRHWISPKTARRLSCDASLVTVLEDDKGRVLNVGRRTRTVPATIGRALAIRDRTCRFPGCCESRYVDAHHIQHWVDGGETSLDNLVTLCRYHHRQLHKGSFSISVHNNQAERQLVFSTPAGRTIETSFFPQFPDVSAETWEEALAHAAPDVNAETCVTKWQGEECDYGMAVDALLWRDGGKCLRGEVSGADDHIPG